MAANLKLYTSDGSTLVTDITFTNVTPGTRSAAQTFRLVNDDSAGAVDTATDPYLVARARDSVTDEPLLRGLRAVDERWIELELTGTSSDDVDQPPTGIEPVGRGRVLRTVNLPDGAWVQLKVYYHPPQSAPEGSVRFTLDGELGPAFSVDQGHSESSRDGIIAGIGDGLHTELVYVGGSGEIEPTGTPDEFVNFPDLAWVHEGIPYVLLADAVELDADDGSSVTLGSNEAYWARFSVGGLAAITVTKSDLFAVGAVDPDDVPAVPEGEVDLGYALRTDAAAIAAIDITSRLWAGRFAPTASGLILTLGTGKARIDNALVQRQARPSITLPASEAANSVWLLPDGNLATTDDGSRPDPRAYLLFVVPTDATDITIASLVDYRQVIGPEVVPVFFHFTGTLTDAMQSHSVWPFGRTGYIQVPRGIAYRWHTAGSGNATGIAKADFKINGTTAYTSAPGIDRRPSIEHDTAVKLATDGLPEVLAIPPFALLTAELDLTEAFDGTAPSGATVAVLVAMP